MTDLTILDLDDEVQQRLVARAAKHGHSTAEEVQEILRRALGCGKPPTIPSPSEPPPAGESLYDVIWNRFRHLGGVELDIPPRIELVDSRVAKVDS